MTVSEIVPAETRLFKPLKVGNHLLSNRVFFAPLTRIRSDDDHVPLPLMEKYYADRGSFPGTLLVTEATAISPVEQGMMNSPGFTTDAQVEAWRKIYAAVHANGSFMFQQLWAMGRAADPELLAKRGFEYHSSSAVPMPGATPSVTPKAMTEDEILDTIKNYAETAKRVVAAGGDGVEIHGAHGYLIDQFATPTINQRTDKWGGSIENRARLVLEVAKAVSAAIGAEKTAIRFSPYAGFQGSEKTDYIEYYTYVLKELKKLDLKLAYISLVEARGDPGAIVRGDAVINAEKTLDYILEEWNNHSPVLVAGSYTPELAARAVETHYSKWDVAVGFGRHYISTPDLVFRVQKNIPFTPYNRATFYLPKQWEGYNDQPFSPEFVEAYPNQIHPMTEAQHEASLGKK